MSEATENVALAIARVFDDGWVFDQDRDDYADSTATATKRVAYRAAARAALISHDAQTAEKGT